MKRRKAIVWFLVLLTPAFAVILLTNRVLDVNFDADRINSIFGTAVAQREIVSAEHRVYTFIDKRSTLKVEISATRDRVDGILYRFAGGTPSNTSEIGDALFSNLGIDTRIEGYYYQRIDEASMRVLDNVAVSPRRQYYLVSEAGGSDTVTILLVCPLPMWTPTRDGR